ncbi:serine-threonine protein kinase [Gordonia sp. NPDC003424]
MSPATTVESWPVHFDEQGDVNPDDERDLVAHIRSAGLTDLVVFSHGWNNDEEAATSLYDRWFELLRKQIGPGKTVGFVGVRWPSTLWRDEPIPDFDPTPSPGGGGGAAAVEAAPHFHLGSPAVDDDQLTDLQAVFPEARTQLARLSELLAAQPDQSRVGELFAALQEFSDAVPEGTLDGEAPINARPGMLSADRNATKVFEDYAARLSDAGADLDGDGMGAAGLGDFAKKLWQGAKEALRQASYWKMKNRAGVVGERGVGPLIARLATEFPELRFHLIGHSFGARVVSFALRDVPAAKPSPVKSVTLLQGAYSRFAFTRPLPFDPDTGGERSGALVGMLDRIDGPCTVCFSSHDRALGTFYPLASAAAGQDSAGIDDPLARWRAMGSHGAFRADTRDLGAVNTAYPFVKSQILNLDASQVVKLDKSPSGAHSDIFHDELAWVVAAAGGLAG